MKIKALSKGEETLAWHLKSYKIQYEREYVFAPPRKWRFDFAWPSEKIAVEVEGAVWANGRHNRPSGFIADLEKYNAAALNGWRVLRFSTECVISGKAIKMIEAILNEPVDNSNE